MSETATISIEKYDRLKEYQHKFLALHKEFEEYKSKDSELLIAFMTCYRIMSQYDHFSVQMFNECMTKAGFQIFLTSNDGQTAIFGEGQKIIRISSKSKL